jgi:transcriptional regulator with PAS, ATPase and Fis domain
MDVEKLSKTAIISEIKLFREQEFEHKRQEFEKSMDKVVHSMLDNFVMGIAIINSRMRVTWLNRTMKQWYPDIDPVNAPFCYRSFYNPPKKGPWEECPAVETFRTGQIHSAETTPTSDGKVYNIVTTPVEDEKGDVVYVIETVEDITRLKQLESQRQKHLSKDMKNLNGESVGTLAQGVGRELGTVIDEMKSAIAKLQEIEPAKEGVERLYPPLQRLDQILEKLNQVSSDSQDKNAS